MSVIAIALKHLIAAGVSGDDLVRAVAEMEAAQPAVIDSVAEKRRAYDRDRKRNQPKKGVKRSGGIPVESADSAETPSPNDIYSNPLPRTPETSDEVSPLLSISEEATGEPPLTPEEILEAWNETAARCGLPKAKLTPQRRKRLAPLIRQHSVNDFTEAIRAVERSSFLRGENPRAWRADFDFFLQPSSFTRLIEGSYDRATH